MTLFDAGSPASEPSPNRARVALVVAYDGTDFHGYAAQRNVRTVEGVLADALATVLRLDADDLGLSCAGRTDTGVHARGQVVGLDLPETPDLGHLVHAVNRITGPEVVVRRAAPAPDGFDARHSARSRTYRYTIVNADAPDPFLARYAWWVPTPLDLTTLRLAADPFVGEHDFAAFCRKPPNGSTTRRVLESRWLAPRGSVLRYEVRAPAFCWQMVRSLVGTLVEVGGGRRHAGDMLTILRSRDRAQAGNLAPPHGLCLWSVDYDELPQVSR